MKGAWFWLDFHTIVKTSLLCVAVLFTVLCSAASVVIWSLRKLDGNRVQLVILVAVSTAPPWGVRPVRVIVLVVWFSRVYTGVAISIVVWGSLCHGLYHSSCWLLWLSLLLLYCEAFSWFVYIRYD